MSNTSSSRGADFDGGDLADHYNAADEAHRLERGIGPLEYERTKELIARELPAKPAMVLDVGGASGAYSFWLAELGYAVHLVDIVPLHIEQARLRSANPGSPRLASMKVGDARALDLPDSSMDAVIMHGPLYHLTEREDRLAAIREAKRVLRPEGVLLAFGITRYASIIVGLLDGRVWMPDFVEMVREEIATGLHRRCASNSKTWSLETAFFHHPDELKNELVEAGMAHEKTIGVLGPAWMAQDLDESWRDEKRRRVIMDIARMLEEEPVLGPRIMVVSRKRGEHPLQIGPAGLFSEERQRAVFKSLVRRSDAIMAILKTMRAVDSRLYLGAGILRNLVWDYLHGYHSATPIDDLDVIYFDRLSPTKEHDVDLESRLAGKMPNFKWSVKNQARMHVVNKERPYASLEDAVAKWPETATALVCRLSTEEQLEIIAPFGFSDLFRLIVTPTPHFAAKGELVQKRVVEKKWETTWPQLRVIGVPMPDKEEHKKTDAGEASESA